MAKFATKERRCIKMTVGSLKTKSEDVKKKSQEVKLCHCLTSGENLRAWSEFDSFRHVEEVVSCDDLLGQLGDPFWVNIKQQVST